MGARSAGAARPEARLDASDSEEIGPAKLEALPRTVLPEAARLVRPGDHAVAGSDAEGWSVIELAEILPAVARPFEEVRARVEEDLRQRRAQEALAKRIEALRTELGVEIDEGRLADEALWSSRATKAAGER
jgi:hypothetical protein